MLQKLATAPSSPVAGQTYYNTTDNKAYVYNGTAWVPWELTTVDTALSSTSTNPVQNKAINTALGNKVDKVSGKGLSTEDYTSAEKTKLAGIATGAEVNQNAFSNVKVGSTTIAADTKTDTLELVAGSNVTLTPDATNDKVTIAATDTTYDTLVFPEVLAGQTTPKVVTGELLKTIMQAVDNVQSDWSQTDTTADDYIKNKPTLGAAAAKAVDTSISSGSSSANLPTSAAVASFVSTQIGAADAMRFKGTIGTGGTVTTLPTSGVKVGDTYRVITAGTYAGQTCEVGDLIIATATTPTWTIAQTNIDGAITSISGTAPVSVTGSGASRTVAISAASQSAAGSMSAADKTKLDGIAAGAQVNPTYNAVTGKPTANQTPTFGGSFTISQVSQATSGQISATDRTVTIPSATASSSANGLMSSTDKAKIDSLTATQVKNATLLSGVTSVSILMAPGETLISYWAFDGSTREEVVVDVARNSGGTAYDFTIAAAYANDIKIYALMLA